MWYSNCPESVNITTFLASQTGISRYCVNNFLIKNDCNLCLACILIKSHNIENRESFLWETPDKNYKTEHLFQDFSNACMCLGGCVCNCCIQKDHCMITDGH